MFSEYNREPVPGYNSTFGGYITGWLNVSFFWKRKYGIKIKKLWMYITMVWFTLVSVLVFNGSVGEITP